MITLFSGILMLGVLVFVHELGHFCIAKWSGVKVLKFSLGFGPQLFSRQWGETEYLISAIPLGGYVQMLGEGGSEDGEEAELSEAEKARSFAHKPIGIRTAIVAAGPIMNLVLPFVLLPISFLIGVNVPAFLDSAPCVGYVVADSSGAAAGIRAGDCILAVNGDPVASWNETNQALIGHAGSQLVLSVDRSGRQLELPLKVIGDDIEDLQLQALGLLPPRAATVGAVSPEMPAGKAGMQVGDRILAIDGTPVTSWYDLKRLIQQGGGKSLEFTLERGGMQVRLDIAPESRDGGYLIGIAPAEESVFKRFGLGASIRAGAGQAVDIIKLTLVFIQKLFSGHVSAKNIGGPIMVFQMAGQAVQSGVTTVLTILAFLSIQLGILNLLPIPILDGGHLFFYLFEFVFRRPLSMRAREMLQQLGLALIVMLMVLAFYNDFTRLDLFGGLFSWLSGGAGG
ncbi:RIP metalloprotease RseP [Geothermobacter hydrogeniphilus]|uniref:Zinc metalloprotease n=1 Tax=Geothermobacter hydrogeniphilus TaxID=1969733 RepID=A0A1X0Y2Y8_9BACT|nr:RIP metalloprotease RseP [Geothermobacter hydrogeniphilus]ORJ59523.1 RIP metalloprotease RseP [Geothermobacter hydrogeniphilus]